ncbi:putative molybdenum cofactor synthesis protein 2 large subunit [Triangularia setosa]|uniref:Molybdopterin synthase catalytic subunit n=1 Tax=Triangularia setosa TaxID=2587417 RepID=A0AAN7A907_9PEZI|nr:putative molybdenum cofactor synthesis protein 2 large subunit [Podospora setosa]
MTTQDQVNPLPTEGESSITLPNIYVALTDAPLDILSIMDKVRSPEAGAIVTFAGTTRNNFASKPVSFLTYTSYRPLALQTLSSIASSLLAKHSLKGIAIVHRLGTVPIGEESILIAVSSAHRKAAWLAGEEALEECKEKVEVWKREEFEDGGVWRANRDGVRGVQVEEEVKR